ncbi:MAG: hypothetical protein DWC11_00080 [Candidatus Poseidoniales archaeon]|nr:MAG: hypothetical protein DWC11_00080 [Candidatus Poseidoniales archaeon]
MRVAGVVLLILLSTLPLHHVSASTTPALSCPETVPLLPGQPTMVSLTQHGEDALTLEVGSIADVQVQDLNSTVADGLRTWTMTLTASLTVENGHMDLSFNLTDGSSILDACTVDLWIRPASALVLGATGESTFTVNEGVTTQVAVNLTNVGSEPEEVHFALSTTSDWAWGWTLNGVRIDDPNVTVQPDELVYIGAWIDVGLVGADGRPLFGTGPSFTLSATSSFDGRGATWSFVLGMEEIKRVSLDLQEPTMPVAPGTDERVEVVVTNRGNVPSKVQLDLSALEEDGTVVTGFEPIDRFQRDGWTVALFGALPDVPLEPGASRTFEVGLLAPWSDEGRMDVRVRATIGAATETVDLSGVVDLQRAFAVEDITVRCPDLEMERACEVRANLRNAGTYDDVATIELTLEESSAGIVNMSLGEERVVLNHGQQREVLLARLSAHPDALAFETATLDVHVGPEGQSLVHVEQLDLRIAPRVEWVFESIVQEEDARQRVSVTATLRNDGNVVDGLVVSMKSSHGMEMGLIPPAGAEYDDEADPIRSFEVEGLPIGDNITLRAWFDLPSDEQVNGTVYVNLSVRSRYVPEQTFQETVSAPYLGVPWQEDANEQGFDIGALAGQAWEFFQVTWHIVLAVGVATIILNRAVHRRAEQRADRVKPTPEQRSEETSEDWMAGFQTKHTAPKPAESRTVDAGAFEQAFRNRSTPSPAPTPAPPVALTEAASVVLEARTSQAAVERLDALAAGLSTPAEATSEIDALLDDLDLG